MIRVRARVHAAATAQGGRRSPFSSGYRPNHNFGGSDMVLAYMGQVIVPGGGAICPGESGEVTVEFINAPGLAELLTIGRVWQIQEGPRPIASAQILEVIPEA